MSDGYSGSVTSMTRAHYFRRDIVKGDFGSLGSSQSVVGSSSTSSHVTTKMANGCKLLVIGVGENVSRDEME